MRHHAHTAYPRGRAARRLRRDMDVPRGTKTIAPRQLNSSSLTTVCLWKSSCTVASLFRFVPAYNGAGRKISNVFTSPEPGFSCEQRLADVRRVLTVLP